MPRDLYDRCNLCNRLPRQLCEPGNRRQKAFQNPQAQHGRQCPQLTHREREHFLVGFYEALDTSQVEQGILGLDNLCGKVVDARVPCLQARELALIVGRQILLHFAERLRRNVIVVQQPFSGRRELSSFRGLRLQATGSFFQY